MQVGPVPWSEEAPFRLPVATWRAAMDDHYPGSTFIRLSTVDARRAGRLPVEARDHDLGRDPGTPAEGSPVNPLDAVGAVADAVLFEGYLLYPYRASAQKNRLRWQFGVLTP